MQPLSHRGFRQRISLSRYPSEMAAPDWTDLRARVERLAADKANLGMWRRRPRVWAGQAAALSPALTVVVCLRPRNRPEVYRSQLSAERKRSLEGALESSYAGAAAPAIAPLARPFQIGFT